VTSDSNSQYLIPDEARTWRSRQQEKTTRWRRIIL